MLRARRRIRLHRDRAGAAARVCCDPVIATSAVAVAGLSMMVTPLLAKLARAISDRLEPMEHEHNSPDAEMAEMRDHVVIGGFGRVGQTVARVLDSENVPLGRVRHQRRPGHRASREETGRSISAMPAATRSCITPA